MKKRAALSASLPRGGGPAHISVVHVILVLIQREPRGIATACIIDPQAAGQRSSDPPRAAAWLVVVVFS